MLLRMNTTINVHDESILTFEFCNVPSWAIWNGPENQHPLGRGISRRYIRTRTGSLSQMVATGVAGPWPLRVRGPLKGN